MPAHTYSAYILHRMPYRETSYLVDIFTYEQGKIRGVARGVRGSKSDRKSLLQAFQLLEVNLSGRNELKNIGRIEAKDNSFKFPERNMFCAMYLNELANRVLPESLPFEDVFEHYQASLQSLCQLKMDNASALGQVEGLLRGFEIKLLTSLGYMPDLSYCHATGEKIQIDSHYQYHQEQGFELTRVPSANAVFTGQDLQDIDTRNWSVSSLRAAKQIMRLALKPLVGDKPLKSRELFGAVR